MDIEQQEFELALAEMQRETSADPAAWLEVAEWLLAESAYLDDATVEALLAARELRLRDMRGAMLH